MTELDWKDFTVKGDKGAVHKIHAAQVGFAVLGDEVQIIVTNDIFEIKSVVWRHDDGTMDWLNPPEDPYKKQIEKELLTFYPPIGG